MMCPRPLWLLRSLPAFILLLAWLGADAGGAAAQDRPAVRIENRGADEAEFGRVFEALDPSRIPTGLLVDQVAALVDPTRYDGTPQAPPAALDDWRQLYHQLSRSGTGRTAAPHPRGGRAVAGLPSIEQVNRVAARYLDQGLIPLAVMSIPFAKIAPEALDAGLLVLEGGRLREGTPGRASPYSAHRVFAAAAFEARGTQRSVRFVIPPDLYFSRGGTRSGRFSVDFGDGRGTRTVRVGEVVPVTYDGDGDRRITITAQTGGQTYTATTTLAVSATAVPAPDLVWSDQTALRPYAGGVAGYDAYFFYGAGNTAPTRPVVFVEGFDPNYSDPARRRTWEDMYEILLEQDFVTRLRALGYDAVIMKLDNAADFVQRNAFALEHLLRRLAAVTPPGEQAVVVGPSMGGLIGRYALAYMEHHGLSHNVRLFASLDAPQQAANLPLGIQYFLEFNDGDSELAAQGKAAVNSVAARQMLAYQYRAFPNVDPLRTTLVRELTTYGYPSTRNIAIANGSGAGQSQRGNERVNYREMVPGDKIVEYRYRSWYVDLDGDVWALPDRTPETLIFEGLKDVIGPQYRAQNVYVSDTQPYDNTPGGSRNTQQDIADSEAPYGDILTAFPDHSFTPTVSALDLDTPDLAYDVAADPAGLTAAPAAGKRSSAHFDALFFPQNNEPHVFATAENAGFLLGEIDTYILQSRTIAGGRTFNSGQHVVVADGVRLTFDGDVSIAPGVRFSLGRDALLFFRGRVTARGTAGAPVTFVRSGGAAWGHLDLAAGGNLFEHVVFDGGTKTVEVRSRGNTFRRCTFRNGWRGISTHYAAAGGRSSFTLEHSTVAANRSVGVVAYHTEPRFLNVTIRDNAQPGLWAYDAAVRVFYRSVVTNNARTQTSRSGIEVLGGSYVGFVGPDQRRGYTRVVGNTAHEVYVSSSASGVLLGYYGYGGYNAVFDTAEGAAAATELLLRSTHPEITYADEVYWGGVYPDGDDVSGPVYLGTVLYTDPTGGTPALALAAPLHAQATTTTGAPGDLRQRMAEIRRTLQQEPHGTASAALLRELFMLQRLDPDDGLGERGANRAVIAAWRAKLAGADAGLRQAGETAALLEIRDALFEERYSDAASLLDAAAPHVRHPEHRRTLLMEQVSLLEHEGRFADALAVLDEVTASAAGDEPPALYAIVREMLEERLAAHGGALAVASSPPTTGTTAAPLAAAPTNGFALGAGRPNPFNPVTTVPFTLESPAHVRIAAYDVLGRRVAVLADDRYEAGIHDARFDAGHLPSGLYLVRAQVQPVDGRPLVLTQTVTLLK